MILFCPEKSIGNQEVLYFRSAVIVNQRAPVWMGSLSRVKMLVQTRSIKRRKSEGIAREVCRYPVENNTNVVLVHRIHKIAEVIRRSVSCCRCVIACYLITPGFIERMLHHRHQLNMGVAELFHIRSQHRSDLTVVIKFTAIVRFFPGAKMHFINRNRRFVALCDTTLLHPVLILPRIFSKINHNTRIVRTQLCCIRVWIRFQIRQTALCLDFIFIDVARANTGDKELVNSGLQKIHLICSSVPVIEISDNTDTDRIRCPDSEVNTADTIDLYRVCTQLLIDGITDAVFKLFLFLLGELHRIGVRIVMLHLVSVAVPVDQRIGRNFLSWKQHSEKSRLILANHLGLFSVADRMYGCTGCAREKRLNQNTILRYARSQDVSWMIFLGIDHGFYFRPIHIIV